MEHKLTEGADWFDCSCGAEHLRVEGDVPRKCNEHGHDPNCSVVTVDLGKGEFVEHHMVLKGLAVGL